MVKSNGDINRAVEGKVFIGITGDVDSTYKSENVRRDLIIEAARLYNERHPDKKVSFTASQVSAFSKLGMFGMPMMITVAGSLARNVEVNMKKVNKRTVTSLIAVMSMSVLFLFTLGFPILL